MNCFPFSNKGQHFCMCSALHLLRVSSRTLIIFSLTLFQSLLLDPSHQHLCCSYLIVTKKSRNQPTTPPPHQKKKSLETTYSSSYHHSPALHSQISGLSCLQCLSISSARILFTNTLIYLCLNHSMEAVLIKVTSFLHIT